MMRYTPIAIIATLLWGGCASNSSTKQSSDVPRHPRKDFPSTYPATLKPWHGIDVVEFVQEFQPKQYPRLFIESLDVSEAKLPPRDENTYQPTADVLEGAPGVVLGYVERTVGRDFDFVRDRQVANSSEDTLVLRMKLTEINPGSRAARYFVGFGAGSAWVKINGELLEAKSGKVFVRFEQRRIAAVGGFGGDYYGKLTDCVRSVGHDVGDLLVALKRSSHTQVGP